MVRGFRGQSAKGGSSVQLIKDDAMVETAKKTKKQGRKETVASVGKSILGQEGRVSGVPVYRQPNPS